jgi:hypothetical protein
MLSCFGNFSMGELGNAANASLDNIKKSFPLKFQKIEAGKFPCVIPGFAPPQLPTLSLPAFPFFLGLPTLNLFCLPPIFLPSFALTLPAISIPLPPIPGFPPIPLPIPNFSLPFLPLLPSFDLGSLSFFCGLFNINLPILDPFAFLNELIKKLNALIAALNDWLKFCKDNAETINATEIPPENTAAFSIEESFSPAQNIQNTSNGITVPTVTSGDPGSLSLTSSFSSNAQVDFSTLNLLPSDPASDLAILLANDEQIPADGTIISQLAAALAPLGTIGEVSEAQVQQVVDDNNIPSVESFIGFTSGEIDIILETATILNDLYKGMVDAGLIMNNVNIKKQFFDVLDGKVLDQNLTSGLDIAIALNASGIPYGDPGLNLLKIKREDIARAFFIRSISSPPTTEKILSTLTQTGVVDTSGSNLTTANIALTPLPEILTPTNLEAALRKVIPGPTVGSLKAMCIAASKNLTSTSLAEINVARQEALIQISKEFQTNTTLQSLLKLTYSQVRKIFEDVSFPISIYEAIPILAIEFEIDDKFWTELFSSFVIPRQFLNFDTFFAFLSSVLQASSSKANVIKAITDCNTTKQSDFVFDKYVRTIETTLQKFSLTFPTDEQSNKQIANALKLINNYPYSQTASVLGSKEFQNSEELTFTLLMTGLVATSLKASSPSSIDAIGKIFNPISIEIQSPTRIVTDIDVNSISIILNTKQSTSAGIISMKRVVMENGIVTAGSTVTIVQDDLQQIFRITIFRIGGFQEFFEALDDLIVSVNYFPLLSTKSEPISQNSIIITS